MYTYADLKEDTLILKRLGYRVEYIATTVYGKDIPAFVRGEKPDTLITGCTHAREHITAKLVVDLAKRYYGTKIAFIPMLNPDGVLLIEKGISAVPDIYRDRIMKINPSEDFTLWKANGRGVDINVNYPADWGTGVSNVFSPSSQNYVGEYPASENETKGSMDFVLKYGITTLISYHAKGEVIYWSYKGKGNRKRGEELAKITGYDLSYAYGSAGGFKDWFIQEGLGEGYTVEVGQDRFPHPYPYSEYGDILSENVGVLQFADEKADD